jgi:hypothetical protein
VITGDSDDEAYTAIVWGVGLSLERSDFAWAEGFYSLEGNMCAACSIQVRFVAQTGDTGKAASLRICAIYI